MQYSAKEKIEMSELMEQYNALRTEKKYAESDALRKEIEKMEYDVRDGKEGSTLAKKFF